MSVILLLMLLSSVRSAAGAPSRAQVSDVNVFLTMAWQVANHINPNGSCYVCGVLPYTAGEGLPLMALPASDCDTCRLLHIPPPQHRACARVTAMRPLNCSAGRSNCQRCLTAPTPVPVLLIPRPFEWCLESDGDTHVGRSDCVRTFRWDPHAARKPLDPAPRSCLDRDRLGALALRSARCSISAPVGMYWVCGNLAYPFLPAGYGGRCGLAHVIPAMRVAHALPRRPGPKRERRGVSDIFGTHHQSSFKNVLGPVLPFYGVMSALDQIADLSRAVEVVANETAAALALISSELASVRLVALQNRAALDYLLAAQGGTCAVVGSECCTFVPEYNATIHDIINHLHDAASSAHQDGRSMADWLTATVGSLSFHIIEIMIASAVLFVLLSLILSCVKKFLFNC